MLGRNLVSFRHLIDIDVKLVNICQDVVVNKWTRLAFLLLSDCPQWTFELNKK